VPSPVNTALAPGAVLDLYAMLTNSTEVSQSYEIKLHAGTPGGPLVDAWRFDTNGCEGQTLWSFSVTPPAPLSKTCPSMQGSLPNIQVKDYQYDTTTGKSNLILANLYPNNGLGNPADADPSKQYFLADFHFDFTFGVTGPGNPPNTCGGIEQPVCWAIYQTDFINTAGDQVDWVQAQNFLTVNDPNNSSHCPGAVPAVPATWGQIKGAYHN
jgi:hypothetical protein